MKTIRAQLAVWVARALGVPIAIRDEFWSADCVKGLLVSEERRRLV